MSDYKRFVSYIYGYNQGEKGENTGFVKVNARGGECKIWVHVKGFYTHRQKPYRVYVFAQKKEWLEGQYLGELESRNGALEWNGVTRTDSLMGGFSLDESRGIYIEGENRVLAAEWDDYPVDVERFHPLERYARQRSVEEDTGKVERNETESPAETFTLEGAVRESFPETASGDSLSQSIPAEAFPVQAAQMKGETEERSQIQPEDPRKRQWEYLTAHFPVSRYQDGNGAIMTGIRLGSRELSRIPRDKWGLGNNSFLLHGFYQHHHLLLIRRQSDTDVSYYIGVPGIYNEKEQMLASMFGFEEFRMMKGAGTRGEEMGYWCRMLQ